MRNSSGKLTHRVHLLHLPEPILGFAQAFLLIQPFGDVDSKLVGSDNMAMGPRSALKRMS